MKKLFVLLLPLISLTGCWEVSRGERAGVVTRFSYKGAFCKTWEGELHYAGANGTIAADSWTFSIDRYSRRGEDIQKLSDILNEAQRSGKRVRIEYAQEMITGPCRSGTNYLVQKVEIVE